MCGSGEAPGDVQCLSPLLAAQLLSTHALQPGRIEVQPTLNIATTTHSLRYESSSLEWWLRFTFHDWCGC